MFAQRRRGAERVRPALSASLNRDVAASAHSQRFKPLARRDNTPRLCASARTALLFFFASSRLCVNQIFFLPSDSHLPFDTGIEAAMRVILPLLLIAAPSAAQVRAIPAQPASEREALRGVEVILINEGAAPVPAEGPRQIEVTAADGTRLVLERLPAPAASVPQIGRAHV